MYKRVLLAYDGSQSGQKALLDCREIVQWSQAELHLIAVMPTTVTPVVADGWAYGAETEPADRAEYEAILAAGLRRLTEAGLSARGEVVAGSSVDEIVRCAQTVKADLIVVGHQHRISWAERWWRGSVSKALIEHAPCSVLVVITA
ncbi:MAG: universal stress protein [Burkholderiales bacterium]|jgi:nucleotide-binding universal stress UspA family protein